MQRQGSGEECPSQIDIETLGGRRHGVAVQRGRAGRRRHGEVDEVLGEIDGRKRRHDVDAPCARRAELDGPLERLDLAGPVAHVAVDILPLCCCVVLLLLLRRTWSEHTIVQRGLHVGDGHVCARREEEVDRLQAQTGGAAGDQHGFVLEGGQIHGGEGGRHGAGDRGTWTAGWDTGI